MLNQAGISAGRQVYSQVFRSTLVQPGRQVHSQAGAQPGRKMCCKAGVFKARQLYSQVVNCSSRQAEYSQAGMYTARQEGVQPGRQVYGRKTICTSTTRQTDVHPNVQVYS